MMSHKLLLLSITIVLCCSAYAAELPAFSGLDQAVESGGSEPISKQLIKANRKVLDNIIKNYSSLEADIRKKLTDDKLALEYRLIYAAILAAENNRHGKAFLIRQAEKASRPEVIQSAFWIIVNYARVLPVDDPRRKKADLTWAEYFMVKEYKEANVDYTSPYERRALVTTYLLPQLISMRNIEVYNIMHPDTPISQTDLLTNLDDLRTVQIMIGKLLSGRDMHVQSQLAELVRMNSEPAIKLLLYNLKNPRACKYLAKFKDKRVLPAIKEEIPKLSGKPKVEAALVAADLEKVDKVPVLIKLADKKDPKAYNAALKHMAMMQDKRFVAIARDVMTEPETLDQVDCAIRILQQYNSRETIRGLIAGMYVNYNALAPDRGRRINSNLKYNKKLLKTLKEFTSADRGFDGSDWLNWYIEHKRFLTPLEDAKPITPKKVEPTDKVKKK